MKRTRVFTSLAVLFTCLTGCSAINTGISSGIKSGLGIWETRPGPSESLYQEHRLVDCPNSPNCISTQSRDPEHAIVPFTYSKPLDEAIFALKAEMAKIPHAKLIKEDGPYFHFECRTKVFRFIHDIEFLFDEQTKTLRFRSASRFGYSDWGVNRERMEDIRNKILGRI
ncbi:MAG: DUF1499 domain-containing protein [Bdellovibrionales bacterium]|nr:DUF1499 domain-containing protein [Bdellovibrionales bacterium]